MRLLIIDDDTELCQLVADYLKPMGFQVEMEHDGECGADRATSETWAAVILDVMMPGCDGFEVLRRIRAKSRVPVMMLTGRGEEVDRIVGLELGADDYLPKTFSSRELLARLRAVLRRSGWISETAPLAPIKEFVIGELRINPETHYVILGDQPVLLTPAEFGLLLSLARAHGRVKTREQLIEEVADREWDVFDRAIDMHISTLRKKLGDDPKEPRFIKTVRGYGYQLVTPSNRATPGRAHDRGRNAPDTCTHDRGRNAPNACAHGRGRNAPDTCTHGRGRNAPNACTHGRGRNAPDTL